VNAERKVSLVDPLVAHFVWIHAWWDSIFMLDVKWSKISHSVAHRLWLLTAKQ
jgi:hypothetical protein